MNTFKNNHLNCVLDSHKMKNVADLVKLYVEKRTKIVNAISEKFKDSIYNPLNSGSYAKHTCINKKFDFDVCIPFKKNGHTLKEMFDNVYKYFDKEFRIDDTELITVQIQKVSIGLEFLIYKEDKNFRLQFDIVPGREVDNYINDKYLNLYLNDNWGNLKKANYIQTNIQKHIDLILNKTEERKIIRILKIWKSHSNYQLKSFLIELMTLKAFEKDNTLLGKDLWTQLEQVIKFIIDNITKINIKDPANEGNIISDTITDSQKEDIKTYFESILKSIGNDEDQIKTYFPINQDFPCNNKEELRYSIKDKSVSTILPPSSFA